MPNSPSSALSATHDRHIRRQRQLAAIYVLAQTEFRELPELAAELYHVYGDDGTSAILARMLRAVAQQLEGLVDGST